MKKYFYFLCCCIFAACNNQSDKKQETTVPKDTVPAAINTPVKTPAVFSILSFDKNTTPLKDSIKGAIIEGAAFKDAEGEYTVLLTETAMMIKNDTQNKTIYAYCFSKEGNSYKRKWLVQDKIDDCDVDATCEFFPGSLSISDADSNHIAEITFVYQLACSGDVSPNSKKLIMYQGANKYAMRGATILQTPAGKEGGDKKIDASFTAAPKPLLDYANKQWDKFGFQKY